MTFEIQHQEGPTVIPYRSAFGGEGGRPQHPADYGRYLPIDLDANNRHSIEQWRERFPDREFKSLGWGVCRSGFGLQNLPWMNEQTAREAAKVLNASTPIGEPPDPTEDAARTAFVRGVIEKGLPL